MTRIYEQGKYKGIETDCKESTSFVFEIAQLLPEYLEAHKNDESFQLEYLLPQIAALISTLNNPEIVEVETLAGCGYRENSPVLIYSRND